MKGGEELDDLDRYSAALPAILLPPPDLTEAQAAELRERFAAMSDPAFFVREWRRACLRALPRRTRLRLWFTRRVDGIAIWLCDHRQFGAAETLWRVSGLWQKAARRRAR